ncbi:hypothetical protein BKA65DRAFT_594977 [Rhexocercosporidium sp. MPI-PUGE-AT-0058]|nr:hypothetical protein BKA65DRAFT_594977 [Rhexocercosporidium sp. MPI-PUGE-AT-0058]
MGKDTMCTHTGAHTKTHLLKETADSTYALEHGEDPLFGTIPLNTSGKVASNWIDENQEHVKEWNGHFLFKPASQTVTVVCNTTYILCDSHLIPTTHGYCRRFGGYEELLALIIGLQEGTIPGAEADPSRQGFVELLVNIVHYSSMDFSAVAVNGVFANNHLLWDLDHQFDLKIQRFLDQISGHRELTRLFLSTRMRFLLAARRAVLQEWLVPLQQQGSDYGDVMRSMLPPNENTSAMCKATLVPDSNYKTTTARPWIVVAFVWLVVVLITYSAPLVLMFHWKWAEDIEREWVARKVGNLHKRLQQGQPIDSEIRPRDLKSGKEATNMPHY